MPKVRRQGHSLPNAGGLFASVQGEIPALTRPDDGVLSYREGPSVGVDRGGGGSDAPPPSHHRCPQPNPFGSNGLNPTCGKQSTRVSTGVDNSGGLAWLSQKSGELSTALARARVIRTYYYYCYYSPSNYGTVLRGAHYNRLHFPPSVAWYVTLSPTVDKNRQQGRGKTLNAQQLIAHAIDHARAKGMVIPSKYKGAMAREVGTLVKDGVPPDAIRGGLELLVEQGLDPSRSLASLTMKVQAEPELRLNRADRELIEAWRKQTGLRWPTGSRWVRSTQSGTYVQDPLGIDRPTYAVPWDSPTREEFLRALRAVQNSHV